MNNKRIVKRYRLKPEIRNAIDIIIFLIMFIAVIILIGIVENMTF